MIETTIFRIKMLRFASRTFLLLCFAFKTQKLTTSIHIDPHLQDCKFFLHSHTEPIIESSKDGSEPHTHTHAHTHTERDTDPSLPPSLLLSFSFHHCASLVRVAIRAQTLC